MPLPDVMAFCHGARGILVLFQFALGIEGKGFVDVVHVRGTASYVQSDLVRKLREVTVEDTSLEFAPPS